MNSKGGGNEIKLKASMEQVEVMSKQAAASTAEISSSTVEQVEEINSVLTSMEDVQKGMEDLAAVLNEQ